MITMEPINLVTGNPGAGKTLFAIDLLRKCKAEGLRCYHLNVNGLDPSIAEQWDGPIENWRDLPEASVLLVDEAHGVFPVRRVNTEVPEHITALAQVRHRGMRIIIVDQDPTTIDTFIRKRVGAHYHLVNRTGFDTARVFSSRSVINNPSSASWSTGESDLWKYPKDLYGKYKSASLHIKKRRIPKKFWFLIAAVLVAVVSSIWTISGFIYRFSVDDEPQAQEPLVPTMNAHQGYSVPMIGKSAFSGHNAWTNADTFAHAHTPLIPGVPWSAPVFQNLPLTTVPDMLCIRIGEVRCRCFTEQMTRLDVERSTCYAAVDRGVYNPYRAGQAVVQIEKK